MECALRDNGGVGQPPVFAPSLPATRPPAAGGETLLSLRNLSYYALSLVNDGTSPPAALVGLGVILASLRWGRSSQASAASARPLLWSWLAAGYVALRLSVNKTPDRYPIFLLTPVAVLLAAGIVELERGRAWALVGSLIAGTWSWAGWTFQGAWTPPLVYYRPPAHLDVFRPGQEWIRFPKYVPEGDWPLGETVRRLAAMAPDLKRRSRRVYLDRHDASAAPEQQIRAAFLGLLRREPDPASTRVYARLLAGPRTPPQILREIAASEEFRGRPLRVAVAPDQPLINAATLNYYAAAQRVGIDFLSREQASGQPWETAIEAVLVVEGDGRSTGDMRQRLVDPGSGFERILALRCPGNRVLEVFAPRPS